MDHTEDDPSQGNAALHSLYGKCSLFVRNLSYEMTSKELEEFFESIGPIRKCFVVSDKETGKCKGYGFVIFALEDHAKQALEELNGKRFHDRRLMLERALRRQNSMEQEDRIAIIQEKEKLMKKTPAKKDDQSASKAEKKTTEAAEKVEKVEKTVSVPKRNRTDVTDSSDHVESNQTPAYKKFKSDDEPKHEIKKQQSKKTKVPAKKLEAHLKVSNLPKDVTKKQIFKKVKKYDGLDVEYPIEGELNTAKIRFENMEKAESAKEKLDKHIFKGNELSAHVIAPNLKQWRLIIRNIPFQYYEKHVMKFFEGFGKIMECKVPLSEKGKPRGFAFIQFSTQKEAQKAIDEKNGSKLGGREIAVDFALPQADYCINKEALERIPEGVEVEEQSSFKGKSEKQNDDEGDVHSEEEEEKDDENDEDEINETEENGNSLQGRKNEERANQDEQKRKEEQMKRTVFIRNLGFDISKDELVERLQEFGRVEYCYIVMDQLTERSRGTAFACFRNQKDADELIRRGSGAPELDSFSKSSLLSGITTEGLSIRGRPFFVCPAVDRGTAQKITEMQKKKKDNDKRNLFLAKEGEIEPNTPAAESLSQDELSLRLKMKEQKYRKLKNTNFFVSKTRLSVHNIPKKMDKKELRELFREAATGSALKDNPIIKQAIILKPKDESNGVKSLGYGFVDFSKHEHALQALRKLNNNPNVLPDRRRLIVEFAVEDSRKIAKFKVSMAYGKKSTNNAASGNAANSVQSTINPPSKRKAEATEKQESTPAKKQKKTANQKSPTKPPAKPQAKSPAKAQKQPPQPKKQSTKPKGDLENLVSDVGAGKAKKFKKPRGIKLDREDRHLDALVHKHRSKMLKSND